MAEPNARMTSKECPFDSVMIERSFCPSCTRVLGLCRNIIKGCLSIQVKPAQRICLFTILVAPLQPLIQGTCVSTAPGSLASNQCWSNSFLLANVALGWESNSAFSSSVNIGSYIYYNTTVLCYQVRALTLFCTYLSRFRPHLGFSFIYLACRVTFFKRC